MASFLMFIIGVLLFYLVGFLGISLLDRKGSLYESPLFMFALLLPIGMAGVSFQMFLYSLVSVSFGFFVIATPWLLLLICSLYFNFIKLDGLVTLKKPVLSSYINIEKILFLVIAFQFIYLCSFSLYFHPTGWDVEHIWFLKARAFFIDGGVTKNFLLNELYFDSQPDYPLMVPLSVTWLYTSMGYVDERIVKLIYPLQFISLLAMFFFIVKSFSSRYYAFIFTALLSLCPVLLVHSGGYPEPVDYLYTGDFVGYADLTLALCFLSAFGSMYMYMMKNEDIFFFLTLIFFAVSGWVKNEGLVFMVLGFLIIFIYIYIYDRGRLKYFLISLSFPLVFILPWMIYKNVLGINGGSVFEVRRFGLVDAFFRLFSIFYNFGKHFLNVNLVVTIWYLYFAFLLLNLRRNLNKPLVFLNLLLFLQFGAYVMAYFFSTKGLGHHLSTSLDRVIFHLTPLALLIAAISSYEFFHKGENPLSSE